MRISVLSLALLTALACTPQTVGSIGGSNGTVGLCGSLVCPPGCSESADCTSCIPESGDAGLGSTCEADPDCCTGVCVDGICSASGSTGTTGTGATSGTTGASSSSGTTSGNVCIEPPAGNGCSQTADCANTAFFCNPHGDGGFCKAKCPGCACLAGDTCDTNTGECVVATTTTTTSATGTTAAATTHGASVTGTTGTATSTTTGGGTTHGATTVGTGTTSGASHGTTASGTTGGSSGTIPIGDTCSTCFSDTDCSGSNDWCIIDENSIFSGYCAPDCTTGTCASGYACQSELDADGFDTPNVCYPNAGTCLSGGSGGTIGGTGGSTGGSTGGVGTFCSSGRQCTSDYCPSRTGVCTCNCGGDQYPCASDADCCSGPGQGNSCEGGSNFSSGCGRDGFCQ